MNPFIRIVQDTYIDTRSKQRFYGHKRMTRAYSCDLHVCLLLVVCLLVDPHTRPCQLFWKCPIYLKHIYLCTSTFMGYKHGGPCDLGIMTQMEKGVTVCACVHVRTHARVCALLSLLLVPRFHSTFSVKLTRSDTTEFWCCGLWHVLTSSLENRNYKIHI